MEVTISESSARDLQRLLKKDINDIAELFLTTAQRPAVCLGRVPTDIDYPQALLDDPTVSRQHLTGNAVTAERTCGCASDVAATDPLATLRTAPL